MHTAQPNHSMHTGEPFTVCEASLKVSSSLRNCPFTLVFMSARQSLTITARSSCNFYTKYKVVHFDGSTFCVCVWCAIWHINLTFRTLNRNLVSTASTQCPSSSAVQHNNLTLFSVPILFRSWKHFHFVERTVHH